MTAGTTVRYRQAVVALALALGACGGGDGKAPPAQEDKARAERIVFTEADFPDLARQPTDNSDDDSDPFRKCLNDNQVLVDLGRGARSAEATFGNEDETVVRSSAVSLAESGDDAKAAFDEVSRKTFVGCFEDAITTGFEEGIGTDADLQNLKVDGLSVDKHGDETVAYRATVDVVAAQEKLSLAFDYVFFRVNRAVAVLFSFDVGQTLDKGERNRLSKILTDRMADEV
ncbi:MAG: hypothetical protein QOG43_1985 [Actinomycetota bacterium]|jgi:hypothetical protein|nr:hypothetical protein [Actinomycetota bacterium]